MKIEEVEEYFHLTHQTYRIQNALEAYTNALISFNKTNHELLIRRVPSELGQLHKLKIFTSVFNNSLERSNYPRTNWMELFCKQRYEKRKPFMGSSFDILNAKDEPPKSIHSSTFLNSNIEALKQRHKSSNPK